MVCNDSYWQILLKEKQQLELEIALLSLPVNTRVISICTIWILRFLDDLMPSIKQPFRLAWISRGKDSKWRQQGLFKGYLSKFGFLYVFRLHLFIGIIPVLMSYSTRKLWMGVRAGATAEKLEPEKTDHGWKTTFLLEKIVRRHICAHMRTTYIIELCWKQIGGSFFVTAGNLPALGHK